ncbi:hypothetical protein AKJ16_DCAP24740, partial [Drosera capensis]
MKLVDRGEDAPAECVGALVARKQIIATIPRKGRSKFIKPPRVEREASFKVQVTRFPFPGDECDVYAYVFLIIWVLYSYHSLRR